MATETFERLDEAALAALRARAIPRLRATDMLKQNEPDKGEEQMAIADEYFRSFVARGNCICCGAPQGGLFGAFEWGLANGEGFCGRCRYPSRAIHRIKGVGVLDGIILQYHPDDLLPA